MTLSVGVVQGHKESAGKSPALWLYSPSAKAEIKNYIKAANSKEAAIADAEAKYHEPIEDLEKLPVIYRWSTTKVAYHLAATDHARLPKCPITDKELPRVPKWRRHLNDIARFVA